MRFLSLYRFITENIRKNYKIKIAFGLSSFYKKNILFLSVALTLCKSPVRNELSELFNQ
jgi:hypothetical protein